MCNALFEMKQLLIFGLWEKTVRQKRCQRSRMTHALSLGHSWSLGSVFPLSFSQGQKIGNSAILGKRVMTNKNPGGKNSTNPQIAYRTALALPDCQPECPEAPHHVLRRLLLLLLLPDLDDGPEDEPGLVETGLLVVVEPVHRSFSSWPSHSLQSWDMLTYALLWRASAYIFGCALLCNVGRASS